MAEKIHNDGRTAQDAGFTVKQLDKREDIDLDDSWRAKQNRGFNENYADTGDVQGREFDANREAVEARRKIMEILGEEDSPTLPQPGQQRRPQPQPQPRQSGGLSMEDLMEGMEGSIDSATQDVAMDLFQQGLIDEMPNEATMMAESYGRQPRQQPVSHDWMTEKYQATLKGTGKKVPVWKIKNKVSGMGMEKPFRIQEAAERIVTILNQTGNANDPRIKSIMEAHDEHIAVMKHIRMLRGAIKEGRKDLGGRLVEAQERLEAINYKLGI